MKTKEELDNEMYRTLLRITRVSRFGLNPNVYFIMVGWKWNVTVTLPLHDFPEEIQPTLKAGKRLHAWVNIGVDDVEKLKFERWEPT